MTPRSAPATPPSAPAIPDAELRELLALVPEVDSVELKLTVPDADRVSAVRDLGIDPLEAHLRQVFFFDTPDLLLDKHGVVARARRIQARGADSTIKLRPVVPGDLAPGVRASKNFVVEVDAMPGGHVCSGSLKGALEDARVKEAMAGSRPLRKLFSKEQRAFFATHAPDGLELDDLTILGPVNVLKLKFTPEGLGRKLAAELWNYPDGTRILELSTRCAPGEMFQVLAESRGFLDERGINRGGDQTTKTRAALEYFSGLLDD